MAQLRVGTTALVLLAGLIGTGNCLSCPNEPATSAELRAQIESLRDEHVAWREIQWTTCLLDGLRESRAQHKPVLLWIFIDRPCDDERC
jgi:hypothetical protein